MVEPWTFFPGVSMASLTELSFNWNGFISAMISNISFTYRSIYSKKAMTDMDSTNLYAYISIIVLIVCIPPAIIVLKADLMVLLWCCLTSGCLGWYSAV